MYVILYHKDTVCLSQSYQNLSSFETTGQHYCIQSFVEKAITQLSEHGCVERLIVPPTCVNPHTCTVAICICLVKPKFHHEELKSLSNVFQRDFWFVTWDIQSGYHHVDIYEPHQSYLGFSWPYCGEQCFFAFTVLQFGLSTACFCFSKLLRPLLHLWRLFNFICFWYLDDGISGYPDIVSASAVSLIRQKDLDKSGLKVDLDKSN